MADVAGSPAADTPPSKEEKADVLRQDTNTDDVKSDVKAEEENKAVIPPHTQVC